MTQIFVVKCGTTISTMCLLSSFISLIPGLSLTIEMTYQICSQGVCHLIPFYYPNLLSYLTFEWLCMCTQAEFIPAPPAACSEGGTVAPAERQMTNQWVGGSHSLSALTTQLSLC